jgi:hypothetical protein
VALAEHFAQFGPVHSVAPALNDRAVDAIRQGIENLKVHITERLECDAARLLETRAVKTAQVAPAPPLSGDGENAEISCQPEESEDDSEDSEMEPQEIIAADVLPSMDTNGVQADARPVNEAADAPALSSELVADAPSASLPIEISNPAPSISSIVEPGERMPLEMRHVPTWYPDVPPDHFLPWRRVRPTELRIDDVATFIKKGIEAAPPGGLSFPRRLLASVAPNSLTFNEIFIQLRWLYDSIDALMSLKSTRTFQRAFVTFSYAEDAMNCTSTYFRHRSDLVAAAKAGKHASFRVQVFHSRVNIESYVRLNVLPSRDASVAAAEKDTAAISFAKKMVAKKLTDQAEKAAFSKAIADALGVLDNRRTEVRQELERRRSKRWVAELMGPLPPAPQSMPAPPSTSGADEDSSPMMIPAAGAPSAVQPAVSTASPGSPMASPAKDRPGDPDTFGAPIHGAAATPTRPTATPATKQDYPLLFPTVSEAFEPSNVMWENLDLGGLELTLRRIIMAIYSVALAYALYRSVTSINARKAKYGAAIKLALAVGIAVINIVVSKHWSVVVGPTEKPYTNGERVRSIYVKTLTTTFFVTLFAATLSVYDLPHDPENGPLLDWYVEAGGFVLRTLISEAIIPNVLALLAIPYRVKWFLSLKQLSFIRTFILSRPPESDKLQKVAATTMRCVLLICAFAPGMPILYAAGLVVCVIGYITDYYVFEKLYQVDHSGPELARSLECTLFLAAILQMVVQYTLFVSHTAAYPTEKVISANASSLTKVNVAVFATVACLLATVYAAGKMSSSCPSCKSRQMNGFFKILRAVGAHIFGRHFSKDTADDFDETSGFRYDEINHQAIKAFRDIDTAGQSTERMTLLSMFLLRHQPYEWKRRRLHQHSEKEHSGTPTMPNWTAAQLRRWSVRSARMEGNDERDMSVKKKN